MVCLGESNTMTMICVDLTDYRPELAGSPEKFFRVLDKIKDPEWQVLLFVWVSDNLFEAGRHDLVVPLVNALGKRTFKSDRLKDVAIQAAFYGGAKRGNQDIVGLYYEHPAITSDEYADGLHESWDDGKPNQVFPFLLEQADQGDLDKAKEEYADESMQSSVKPLTKHSSCPTCWIKDHRPVEKVSTCFRRACLDHQCICEHRTRQHHRGISTR